MAVHSLPEHFRRFFSRLNPSASFEAQASSQYNAIKGLIEDPRGAARALAPKCFLQGSYRQDTAIHTINDVDVVALCQLWHPGSGGGGYSWGRDEIFATIAEPLIRDGRYRGKVYYGPTSMCVKVDLGIKVEILPVVFKQGNSDASKEPFRLFRPTSAQWDDGFARYHQQWLSWKNRADKTGGNFIPAIKVLKHLRSTFGQEAVSFHLECLLFRLRDEVFRGAAADFFPAFLSEITASSADEMYVAGCTTPCRDRDIFSPTEWELPLWRQFHELAGKWARAARAASASWEKASAISMWRTLLDKGYFPEVA